MNDKNKRTAPPIAVVGVGAVYPGQLGRDGFWRDILSGRDNITEVPATHWLIDDYYDDDPAAADKTYCRRGGFIPAVDFEPLEFGIPPTAIPATDTAQLLALVVANQVLNEAATASGTGLDKSRTSVVLGVASATEMVVHLGGRLQRPAWLKGLREAGIPEDEAQAICDRISANYVPWQESSFPGMLGNVVAGRVANRLDLGGTNFVTDAACASSLSALQVALNELYLGESDAVLVGGVDALNDILMYMCFSKTPAFSPTGDCRPFSDKADGTIIGEGIGMFALRRLEDAERDGNVIYAVIRGLGSSSDGRSTSVYAPRPEGQAQALRRAYEAAGYSPATVELMEAHGTATKAGDAAEFAGLRAVFESEAGDAQQLCQLGSVKSQIGHTKAAAGAAGLFKVVMALHHAVLPPTIKVDQPNPALDMENSPFYLSTRPRPWIRGKDHPRRASVSSFGFGGSNFHVTVEEYTGPGQRPARTRALPSELFILSAADAGGLAELARGLAAEAGKVGEGGAPSFGGLARDSQITFDAAALARLAVVAADAGDLGTKLGIAADALADGRDPSGPDVAYGTGEPQPGKIAFLFPGQGSQYVDMGGDLAVGFAPARAVWDEAADIEDFAGAPLHRVVFPPPAFMEETRAAQQAAVTAMEVAQPAIAAVSLSQLALLEGVGLRPDAVAGHSFGEVTALHAAGVFERARTLSVARRRGLLMAEAAAGTDGAMTAVSAERASVAALIERHGLDLVLANDNSPKQVILSGRTADIAAAESLLSNEGLAFRRLPVATAFHSPVVSASREPFARTLEEVDVSRPVFPVYANSTAEPYPADAGGIRGILAQQLAEPVQFRGIVEAMYRDGLRTFIEVGPGNVLTGLVGQCLADRPHAAVSLDRKGQDGVTGLWRALGQLSARGVALDLQALWVDLPPETEIRAAPSKHAIRITGANYGKPYPPPGGAADLPPPNPPRLAETPATVTAQPPTAAPAPAPTGGGEDPWVAALAHFQKQTAETHRQFQQSMAESHQAFLRMSEQALAAMSGGTASSAQTEVLQPMPAPGDALPPSNPAASAVTVEPVPSPPRSEPLSAPAPPPTVQPQPAVPLETVAPDADVQAVLLEVVADKTGYPTEMLDLEMEMEAGLGIDSIKQVEILSALRERLPDLPEVDPGRLAELKTLAQIAGFLVPAAGQKPVAAAPAPSTAAAGIDARALLLEVIADKTGYPQDMLDMDMELEAGLGIDSIKQVEILSALRDRQPGLPEIDPGRLATLTTPARIAEFIDEAMGSASLVGQVSEAPAEVSAEATADETSEAFEWALLDIVAEKTGYPVEMLDLDMELEAGLGIDSIKQVEILSALRDRFPDLPEIEPQQMAELKTLTGILDFLDGADATGVSIAAVSEAEAQGAASAETSPMHSVGRFVPVLQEAPASGFSMLGLRTAGRVVVTPDIGERASALAEELRKRGFEVEVSDDVPADVRAVISLHGIGAWDVPDLSYQAHFGAFAAARNVARNAMNSDGGRGVFVTVQDTGGDFGFENDPGTAGWLGGFAGLVKTMAQECPEASVKAIDIHCGRRAPKTLAKEIADEILSGGPETEVGLGPKGRRVLVALRHEAAGVGGNLVLDDGDVVVASGGARGVTAHAMIALAGRRKLRFALLGRTPLEDGDEPYPEAKDEAALKAALFEAARAAGRKPEPAELSREAGNILAAREVRETLERIAEAGSEARYLAVDICDADALGHVLADMRRDWGGIAAVIHGAGVLADKAIADKTDNQFSRVFRTKVDGLAALLTATMGDRLKALCLFSSAAARSGNPGQCDYAMANEVLNKVAQAEAHRRGDDCVVRSINWGPWDGGMVTDALKAHFERAGIDLILLDAGADFLVQELSPGTARGPVEVLAGSALRMKQPVLRMEVSVDGEGQPYLANHVIKDRPVLPVVLVIEWFMRAARAVLPDMTPTALRDLHVLQGVVLDRFPEPERFQIIAQPSLTNGTASVDMRLVSGDGRERFKGTVELARAEGTAPLPRRPETGELTAWPWRPDEVYEGKLFHGPDFQVIRELEGIGEGGGVGVFEGTGSKAWPGGPWLADPAALDGGMQLALLWGLNKAGRVFLPIRIGAFIPHGQAPEGEALRCAFQTRLVGASRTESDLNITTLDGRLVSEMQGVEMYSIDGGRGNGGAQAEND
jgi:acyl transferase domain-containing protein/acyl carrier protein/NADP-dependent 3-hydroxy acid dehydrogenase YdfG